MALEVSLAPRLVKAVLLPLGGTVVVESPSNLGKPAVEVNGEQIQVGDILRLPEGRFKVTKTREQWSQYRHAGWRFDVDECIR